MIKVVQGLDELLKVYSIRNIVFVEEQNCPYEEEFDEFEHAATHILALEGTEPIACARIRFVGGYGKLERIAIRKKWRGTGFGKNILEFMINYISKEGVSKMKMHAQQHLEGFYNQFGFTCVGEPFLEAGIKHILMVKE